MKIAVIEKKNTVLNVGKESFKVDGQNIPFRLVDLLIVNHKVQFESSDILKLTKGNVSVLILSAKSDNMALVQSNNSKASALKEAQYHALSRRLFFAKYFIRQKVIGHQAQLQRHKIVVEISRLLEQISQAKSIETLMGIEGTFARLYFGHYFSLFDETLHKGKRSKNPPKDPLNAMMSYFYMLYYHLISAQLASYGFELGIGYLHTAFRTHNALASDFMELFRADINEAIFELFSKNILSIEDFSFKGGVFLRFDARKKIWKEYVLLTQKLKPRLDQEIAKLKGEIYEKKFDN